MKIAGLSLLLFIFTGCYVVSETKEKRVINKQGHPILNCQLIQKTSYNKKGKAMGEAYYLRCSIQDYYIKWCESDLKPEDIESCLNQGISVEAEIRNGEWDRCPGDPVTQSRTGEYVVLYKLVE